MIGEGYTVTRGTTPQPFKVEVLGKLTNGIGAGRDMIIVEASDLPGGNVIAQGGDLGRDVGSPIYVNGQLLGAVSYGFSASPSPIGGVTPAPYMYDLLDLGGAAAQKAEPARGEEGLALGEATPLDRRARRRRGAQGASLQPLRVPLSVSGLDLEAVEPAAVRRGQGRAERPGARRQAVQRPRRGGTLGPARGGRELRVSTLSYGDVTAAGIGTTTAVCGDQAVAWGHPFNYLGPVTYGAHNATSLAIIKDETFGPFKLADIGAPFGTVDQDRLSGIRADLSAAPVTTPITTTINELRHQEEPDRQHRGALSPNSSLRPRLSGIWAGYDNVFDEWGSGRANGTWTIKGTREGGVPFLITRANRWADLDDTTSPPAFETADAVDALINQDLEPVSIDSVDFTSTVATTYRQSADHQGGGVGQRRQVRCAHPAPGQAGGQAQGAGHPAAVQEHGHRDLDGDAEGSGRHQGTLRCAVGDRRFGTVRGSRGWRGGRGQRAAC